MTDAESVAAVAPDGRTRVVAVGLALAGAALAAVAATRPWVVVSVDVPAGTRLVTAVGRQVAPAVVALALAAAAAAAVLLTAGRRVRVAVAVGLALAGLGVVVLSVAPVRDPGGAAAPALEAATGVSASATVGREPPGRARATGWPWGAAAGGLLVAAGGLLALARGRSWPAPSVRIERPAPGTSGPGIPPDRTAWDALSRGEDPTAGTAADEPRPQHLDGSGT